MNVLVACEFSGIVRDAFTAKGHYAVSCDLLPTESPGNHYQGNVLPYLNCGWDMIIAHPPCTYLCSSGARWNHTRPERIRQQNEAIAFFNAFLLTDCPRVAIENPIGIMSNHYRKPDQIIQPWMFGHGETKATCLWLKGLPKLKPTNIVKGRVPRVHYESPGKERWKNRSRTYQGIADAMADQWGGELRQQGGRE
jgi:hypothetical protein